MAMTKPNRRTGRRVRARVGVLGVIVGLVVSLATTVFGATAASAAGIPCPNLARSDWTLIGGRPPSWRGHVYGLQSAAQVFNVSEARIVENTLDTPVVATFTSQQSRSYSLSVTQGRSVTLASFLTANVSVTIVQSWTTSIGVSATATVPPHSRVTGLYGIQAYDVIYSVHTYRHVGSRPPDPGDRSCIDEGTTFGNNTNAPTYVEGWRIVSP